MSGAFPCGSVAPAKSDASPTGRPAATAAEVGFGRRPNGRTRVRPKTLGAEVGVGDIREYAAVDAVVADRAVARSVVITEFDAALILLALKVTNVHDCVVSRDVLPYTGRGLDKM